MNPGLPNHLEFTAGAVAPGNWDGLSVTRHKLCHMPGFTQYFYWQGHTDKWSSHVSGTTFDPGGPLSNRGGDDSSPTACLIGSSLPLLAHISPFRNLEEEVPPMYPGSL